MFASGQDAIISFLLGQFSYFKKLSLPWAFCPAAEEVKVLLIRKTVRFTETRGEHLIYPDTSDWNCSFLQLFSFSFFTFRGKYFCDWADYAIWARVSRKSILLYRIKQEPPPTSKLLSPRPQNPKKTESQKFRIWKLTGPNASCSEELCMNPNWCTGINIFLLGDVWFQINIYHPWGIWVCTEVFSAGATGRRI